MGKILCFLLLVVFYSCKNDSIIEDGEVKYISVSDFPVQKTLPGIRVMLDSVPMGSVTVVKIDSVLLFQFDWRVVEHHIGLYNPYDGKFILRLLPVGRGAGESASFIHYGQAVENSSVPSGIWVETGTKFGLLDLHRSIQEGCAVFDRQYDFSDKLELFHKFVKSDSILVGKVYKSKCVPYYIEYHTGQEKIMDTVQIFTPAGRIVEENMYASCDQIRPDGSKLAMAMTYFNILNIVSLDNGRVVSLVMKDSPRTYDDAWKLQSDRTTAKRYYDGICVSDDCIFALYRDCLRNEIRTQAGTQILVFSWEGKLLYRLSLNENISTLSYDKKEDCLYGMSRYGEEVVYRYSLKGVN